MAVFVVLHTTVAALVVSCTQTGAGKLHGFPPQRKACVVRHVTYSTASHKNYIGPTGNGQGTKVYTRLTNLICQCPLHERLCVGSVCTKSSSQINSGEQFIPSPSDLVVVTKTPLTAMFRTAAVAYWLLMLATCSGVNRPLCDFCAPNMAQVGSHSMPAHRPVEALNHMVKLQGNRL